MKGIMICPKSGTCKMFKGFIPKVSVICVYRDYKVKDKKRMGLCLNKEDNK